MKIGLFGFPQSGKTSLFNTLTGATVATGAAGSGRPETHSGVAKVPDARLDRLAAMFKPKKTTYATVDYVDPVGVEAGEAKKSDSFLSDLKAADAIAHVVRAFADEAIPHSQGAIDPKRDVETMETELILSDHTTASRRMERLELSIKKTNRDEERKELELIKRIVEALENEKPLREFAMTEEEERRVRGYTFLSAKPLLVVINVGEADAGGLDAAVEKAGLAQFAKRPKVEVCAAAAAIEMEIARLEAADARAFMDDLGLAEPALVRIIRSSYHLMGLASFFTAGEDECRAWTVRVATRAQQAAGVIHSDIERGFIRAEVTYCDDLFELGSFAACRDKGKLRLEGKEYPVKDGDVVHFRFNV